jgi:amino acid transporter
MKDKTAGSNRQARTKTPASEGTLGTFAGVFTPSVLTILGIILFLRLGFVVGSAGLGRALIILALANGISVLTSVSLSAIATNLKVKGGGDYYLISRTLGLEFGGAIGIVLFLAQSVSIAFYCIGFGEVVNTILANEIRTGFAEVVNAMLATEIGRPPQIIAALAVSFLFILAWLGADWATKFQYVVMSILVAALISFFIGGYIKWDSALLAQNWSAPESSLGFWAIFAIFFPAVTGFTQGVSMSGDLKEPGKSLPRGTFAAVGVSIIVYFLAAVILTAALPTEVLMNDYGAMKRVAYLGILIWAGVIAATLSSAMASFLGAPRILQSLAGDRIFSVLNPFAKGYGPSDNPRRGVLLSAGIAYATIILGQLNLIAGVVSMFFLISYGLLNYATYYEARAASPSFRPRFRYFNKWLSLAGALACLGTMMAIDFRAGIVAIAVLFAIFQYLKRTAGPARWADSRRSYHIQRTRDHLLAAADESEHPRYWRPQILAFADNPEGRSQLLHFASWIEGGSGLTTAVRIIEGEGLKIRKLKEKAQSELQQDIQKDGARAFPLAIAAPDLQSGIQTLVQAYGIGVLKANTILLNWYCDSSNEILCLDDGSFGRSIRSAHLYGCNVVILDVKADKWTAIEETEERNRYVDVWWWGDATSRLMLLMAYLMTRHEDWDQSRLRLLAVDDGRSPDLSIDSIREMLEEVRIEAEPEIVQDADADTFAEYSADAAVAFIPFRFKDNRIIDLFGNPMEKTLFLLPVTAMVLAAEDIELDAEPEEGEAGEKAEALDTLTDARKKAREATKKAEKAAAVAEKTKEKADELKKKAHVTDSDTLAAVEKDALEAEKEAEKLSRKAAKAEVKAKNAAREAELSGVLPEEDKEEK